MYFIHKRPIRERLVQRTSQSIEVSVLFSSPEELWGKQLYVQQTTLLHQHFVAGSRSKLDFREHGKCRVNSDKYTPHVILFFFCGGGGGSKAGQSGKTLMIYQSWTVFGSSRRFPPWGNQSLYSLARKLLSLFERLFWDIGFLYSWSVINCSIFYLE